MLLKTGCGSFPVGRARYFAELSAVEIGSTFHNLPQLSTARSWREEAPKGFEFSLLAWQVITHTAASAGFAKTRLVDVPERRKAFYGHFRASPEVLRAWESVKAVAEAMGARFVVFDTPSSFYPDADHLRDMYKFFKGIDRGALKLVWHPRGAWTDLMADHICRELGLLRAVDPLAGGAVKPRSGAARYFRVLGAGGGKPQPGRGFDDRALAGLLDVCAEKPSYVFFANRTAWQDARRLQELSAGVRDLRRL